MLAERFGAHTAALVAAVTNPEWEPGRHEHEQYREHVLASLAGCLPPPAQESRSAYLHADVPVLYGSRRQSCAAPGREVQNGQRGRNSSKSGEVGGEAVGRLQSVGMVVAEHAAAAGQRVLVQLAGGLVLTKRTQVAG